MLLARALCLLAPRIGTPRRNFVGWYEARNGARRQRTHEDNLDGKPPSPGIMGRRYRSGMKVETWTPIPFRFRSTAKAPITS